jgi:hypothetical protein
MEKRKHSNNFSYSRLSTFETCRWKYFLTYEKHFRVQRNDNTELAAKGTAFHEVAENYKGQGVDELEAEMNKLATEAGVDISKYDYREASVRLWWLMNSWFEPKKREGYSIKHESWVKGELAGKPFVGALDVLVEPSTSDFLNKPIYIMDFKSGKSPRTDSYKTQLMIYAYFIGKQHNWTIDVTATRVKLYVFFPLANLGSKISKLPDDERPAEAMKQIVYTARDLAETVQKLEMNVRAAGETNWEDIDPIMDSDINFTCNFCPYAGIPKDTDAECHCQRSYDNGMRAPRSLKIIKES